MAAVIFLDTNMLYHILRKTPGTEEALTVPDENPGGYVVGTVVRNEIMCASAIHYLGCMHGVKGAYSARKVDKGARIPGEGN